MSQVGIRELKQNASEVVARAEKGESIDITLHGRPVARIEPIRSERRQWVPAQELVHALTPLGTDATDWLDENWRSRGGDPLIDPWEPGA